MSLKKFRISLTILGLIIFTPKVILADKSLDFPFKKFLLSKQTISLTHLSSVEAKEIVTNGNIALINTGRNIWTIKANDNKLVQKNFSTLNNSSIWYGVTCAFHDGFFIAVGDYPEERRNKENKSPSGGFLAGPTPKGFIFLSKTLTERYLSNFIITSQSDDSSKDNRKKIFSYHLNGCAQHNNNIVIGSYGSLGIADFNNGTIELIDEDEEPMYNRLPLHVEKKAIWNGMDEGGGNGGAWLEMRPFSGKVKQYNLSSNEEFRYVTALIRHRKKLFIGTNNGLFSLEENSGHFWHFDFGKQLTNMPVSKLLSHNGFLWVFIGGEWLQVDVVNKKAIWYVDSLLTRLVTGSPFSDGWLLSGPSGIWKYSNNRKSY